MITGNKGEWSEIYVLFRLLSEGKLYAADEQLNRINNMFFPIIKIIREEVAGRIYEYHTGQVIRIYLNDEPILKMPIESFANEANRLFADISRRPASGGSFSLPASETFMQQIFATKLKAPAADKADIDIEIHDSQTGFQNIVGFSIKSDLGTPPTLLNPGKTTNFVFEVCGLASTDIPIVNSINSRTKIIDRMDAIRDKGGKLVFIKMDNAQFKDNLIMIDSQMPAIIAEMLKGFYCRHINGCLQLAKYTADLNPLNRRKVFYYHKIKELLCASALGMTPATEWDGNDQANGGYIIVKTDGDVVAYHIYNRTLFKDYLLRETRLVQASTTRYEFCSLYQENDKIYIRLNLQIRFI